MVSRLQAVLSRTNILIVVYILLVWFSASSFVQYRTVSVIEDDYPADINPWRAEGDPDNAIIAPEEIALVPVNAARTRLGRTYPLAESDDSQRYLAVSGEIISSRKSSFDAKQDEHSQLQESLFYAWFGDENRDSIQVSTMADLAQENRQISIFSIISVPTEAAFVNVELLQRRFQAKHALVRLEIEQIEKTVFYKMCLFVLFVLPMAGLYVVLRKTPVQTSIRATIAVVGIVITLIAGVLIPGDALRKLTSMLTYFSPSIQNLAQQFRVLSIQDTLHFLGFLILTIAVLSLCKINRYPLANGISKIILFAIFTEVIQRHSVERSTSLLDIVVDFAGLTTGAFIWYLLHLALSTRGANK